MNHLYPWRIIGAVESESDGLSFRTFRRNLFYAVSDRHEARVLICPEHQNIVLPVQPEKKESGSSLLQQFPESTKEFPETAHTSSPNTDSDFPHLFSLSNFRRGDEKVRAYILSAILAHRDAENDSIRETAVIDFGREGCHEQNIRYFDDYLSHGRHLGRGHLFVGTLPTTPQCEAAISLKHCGPCYYLSALGNFHVLWDEITMLLESCGIHRVLAFHYKSGSLATMLIESRKEHPTAIPDTMDPFSLIRTPDLFL